MPLITRLKNLSKIIINKNLKTIFLGTLIFIIIAGHLSSVSSQNPYDTAKQQYANQFKIYNDTRNDFLTAKAAYLTFQTAVAKKEAFESIKIYLSESNFLLTNYLIAIQEFGNQINWEDSTFSHDEQIKLIEDEIDYLQNHWQRVQSTSTLEELPPLAEELEEHLEDISYPRINKVLAVYEVVKVKFVFDNYKELSATIFKYANRKIASDQKLILTNWKSEIDAIDETTLSLYDNAILQLGKHEIGPRNASQLKKITRFTQDAKTELQRSKALFEEIISIL